MPQKNKRRIRWSIIVTTLLLIELIVMLILGWDDYCAGLTSPMLYYGGSGVVLICIILLYRWLQKAEQRHSRH